MTRSLVLLTALCLFGLAGCGGKKPVTLKGQVVLPPEVKLGDQDVIVKVVAMDRNRVRLGIIAPEHIAVHRQELLERCDSDFDTPLCIG